MDIHEYQAKKYYQTLELLFQEVELSTVQKMQKTKQEKLVDQSGL